MGSSKKVQRDYAAILYIEQGVSQKEIALRCEVSEKTVGIWKDKYEWDKRKRSLIVVRSEQVTDLYDKLETLNYHIKTTKENLVTTKEVDAISKLTAAIKNLETETNIGEVISVAKDFIHFLKDQDLEFAKKTSLHFDAFIQQRLK